MVLGTINLITSAIIVYIAGIVGGCIAIAIGLTLLAGVSIIEKKAYPTFSFSKYFTFLTLFLFAYIVFLTLSLSGVSYPNTKSLFNVSCRNYSFFQYYTLFFCFKISTFFNFIDIIPVIVSLNSFLIFNQT